jgi:hypothetical protein
LYLTQATAFAGLFVIEPIYGTGCFSIATANNAKIPGALLW